MSRTKKTSPTTEAPNEETAPTIAAEAAFITDHLSPRSGTTMPDVYRKDALKTALKKADEKVKAFIDERIAEGFSLREISELYVLETSIVPVLIERDKGSRVECWYEVEIVERQAA